MLCIREAGHYVVGTVPSKMVLEGGYGSERETVLTKPSW